jgi:excinuclease ABC subunit C
MREVIYRRYYRLLLEKSKLPDLIIVDGGIGQMHVAREVIDSLNLNIPVVGLKKDDHHRTNKLLAFEPIEEINIKQDSLLFLYLERVQDEVHNFTINYHKQIRSKGLLSSTLDSIEGIGSKRRDELLKKYKSLKKMSEASVEELSEIVPKEVASKLKKFLENLNNIV